MSQTKKVIYTSFQPYTFEMAKILHRELGWDPVFWNVDHVSLPLVKGEFPGVITHQYADAVKGKLPDGFTVNDLLPADAALLNALGETESIALNMMNRNYLDVPFSYQERLRMYHRLVRFYSTLLQKLRPDYIILEDTPHEASDYVLYQLAQHYGMKTILCESTMFYDYFFAMERYEVGNLKLQQKYKEMCAMNPLPAFTLTAYGQNEIAKVRGSFKTGMQDYMQTHVRNFASAAGGINKKMLSSVKYAIKFFNVMKWNKRMRAVVGLSQPSPLNYYKKASTSIEDSVLSNFDYLMALRKIKTIKRANLDHYRSLQNSNPDLGVPFIFFALHFQPEKSSSPWGGHYVNQYLPIHMLSKAVPKGWKIYVKDHISQYSYPATGEPFRNKEFFNDVAALENVEFIPMEMISFDLIDKARAVASLAGSVLWEAVARKTPSIAFGAGHHCWCGGCEGIFYTPDMLSLQAAINKIAGGYKVDTAKFELYGHLLETMGRKGYAGGSAQAKRSGITPEQNAALHVSAIKELLGLQA